MTNHVQSPATSQEQACTTLFKAFPGNGILLKPDHPQFTILAVTDLHLRQIVKGKESPVGKGLFEAYPSNPDDAADRGSFDLRASLAHVLQHKEPHALPVVRYDVWEGDRFSERFWQAGNHPVLSEDGTLLSIIHISSDITDQVKAERLGKEHRALREAYHQVEESQAALQTAHEHTIDILESTTDAFYSLDAGFNFTYVNQRAAQLWNRDRDRLLGKHYWTEFPTAVGSESYHKHYEALRTGKPVHYETVSPLLGTWIAASIYPVHDGGLSVFFHDITESKRAQDAIRESEAKLRSILNSAPTAIGVFVGPDLILENPNQLMIDLMGAGPAIEGQSFRTLLSGVVEEDQQFIHLIDTVRTTGEPFEAREVAVFFKAEKTTRYFNINFIPLSDEKGHVYAVLDVSVDVTEQVQTRRKLEESEGRFRLLADASPNLIWQLKPDGSYGYVNKTTLRLLGITQEQIAEAGWEAFLHPDDLAPATAAVTRAVEACQPYEMEHRLRHKDGEYRWVLSQAIPAYDANGHVFAYVGSSIDIHEAKKNRQALQTALEQVRLSKEAAELGTFDMDLEKGTMHWDDRCRTLFGISHDQPVTYERDFVGGLHPDDRERILNVIDNLFIKSISGGDYDVEYRTVGAEDGVVRWVRAKGKVYFNTEDKPTRFIGSVLDITEKVLAIQRIEDLVEERTKELAKANEALQQANKELQRSNANLEEFAHAASHDLKEPIRKIHFFTNQLREQLSNRLNETEARSFSRIQNATQRMGNLIDDLLLYSHVSLRPHETETIDLNEKVQRVLEDLDLDIEEKGAAIHVGKLPVVKGYRRQLQQLFQNLISNALKYSKAGEPPRIEIGAEEVAKAGKSYHLISVKDNGIGFAMEYAEKIFQMFTRLHGKAEYSGTGVGLSIVKKVVENHDGFIEVESAVGEGSVFKIYLPG
ncbi:MAG TPA: PAS domain S-box protein [Flavisolibacter sp.]|jgi:PAS domain S-box-containing protein|nr:PAS domain S-box protein [Flavisolibacter sp.]